MWELPKAIGSVIVGLREPEWRTVCSVISDYVNDLQQSVPDILGVYLYGSIVGGAYVVGSSDVDVMVVTYGRVSEISRDSLLRAHGRYERSIDATYVTRNQANTNEVPTHVEYVVRSAEPVRGFAPKNGTGDFLLNRQHVYERGLCLCGAGIKEVFAPVPALWLKGAALYVMSELVPRAIGQGGGCDAIASGILMASRLLYTLHTGRMASKTQGGRWAMGVLGGEWRSLILSAMERYTRTELAVRGADVGDLERFVAFCKTAAIPEP